MGEFYKHPAMTDGRVNKCKSCTRKDASARRSRNLERARAYDRSRASLPHRAAARARYARSERGALALGKAKRQWSARNPDKRRCQYAVANALRDGRLVKGPCEVCGTADSVQGHHDDYSRPLEVRWLCVTHHAEHHKLEREQARQKPQQQATQ